MSAFVASALPQSPTVLITDARHIVTPSVTVRQRERASEMGGVRKSERDTAFLDRVIETLRRGGNVLIPSDTAGTLNIIFTFYCAGFISIHLLLSISCFLIYFFSASH